MSEDELRPEDIDVYRRLLEAPVAADEATGGPGPGTELSAESVDRLLAHRLLQEDGPHRYEAVSPSLAAAELTASLQVQVHRLMRRIDTARRDLRPLGPLYEEHQRRRLADTTTELLTDGEAVRERLAGLSLRVQHSVLTAHPTLGSGPTLRAAIDLDRDLLDRGVVYRTVVPHTARRQREALAHVRHLGDMGAQVRTAVVIPGRMILLDSAYALVPAGQDGGGALFRDPAVVGFLELIFEHIWDHAKPVDGAGYAADVFEDIELTILRHLERGRSDEFMSRRLGISTRTLRRYLAGICEKLDVETRFQLGMAAARLDLFGDGDDPDSTG
ncbi:LuxR C-terminal-related transcriptional regulator [Streptomyces sp. NPDC048669]|uniref:LuxR C-terminal-related transcriptional regulator n=1 Tax=Streptomyces sp. NPDC048669 TaxID=3155267 RepID=UPI00343566D2